MCRPFFRAAQTEKTSLAHTVITLNPVEITHKTDTRRFDFTAISVENADVYSPPIPSVRWNVRITALPFNFEEVRDRDGKVVIREKKTYFEPHWFVAHVYWEFLRRGGLGEYQCDRRIAIVRVVRDRIVEYLACHPYPAYSEEYDPIVLEIW